jgi:hypothetical protein
MLVFNFIQNLTATYFFIYFSSLCAPRHRDHQTFFVVPK